MATAEWLKGEAYIRISEPAKARPIIDAALARVAIHGWNTKLQGDLMRSRGAIAATAGNIVEALQDYQRAHDIFRAAREVRSQAISLQDIGQIYSDAGDYPRALDYYSQAGELYSADPGFRLSTFNNRAEVLRLLGRYDEAERDYRGALKSARELGSPLLKVQILANLASAETERHKFGAAGQAIAEALGLSRSGDAASLRPAVYAAAAKLKAAQGDVAGAAALLRKTFAGDDLTKTTMPNKEFHATAADVFEKLGDHAMAFQHLKAFERLDKEASRLTASAASQLMAARFDFQNQKQKIFERDARIHQQQAEFRTKLLLSLFAAATIVLVLLLISALRIRKSRNETRAANIVLNQTNTALEKALKAKTEFLATTSHEIRTPLNGILGMAQILLTNPRLDAEAREQVQVVFGAGEAMRALVDDILDVAKMETGEVAVVQEDVAFRAILEDAARLWSGHAAAKDIALHLEIGAAPARILSDGARLRQIIGNLLSNAVKFTREGSVTLRAHAADDSEMLVVEVEDSGIGIPADHIERVFEAFHQVDGGLDRQFSGTGLGLSICRKLAHALGGELSVVSAVGAGSRFTLRVPLQRPDDGADVPQRCGRPASLAEARLLLVEGNPLTQGMMRSILEPVAAVVDCLPDGDSAIAAIRAATADHLLVEARSATVQGQLLMDPLRSLVATCREAGVPISLLFAPGDDLPLDEMEHLGATQLIVKPINAVQLIAALQGIYADEERSTEFPELAQHPKQQFTP
ncbi:ATP-binding protein [Sphingomonas pituitosa]|nr:ATP-binding protein [Sphingomonas pituitosa]